MSKGTASEIQICGKTVRLGDFVKVRYTTGTKFKDCTIKGNIIELWGTDEDEHLQARVESGWCFHDYDEIVSHVPIKNKERG